MNMLLLKINEGVDYMCNNDGRCIAEILKVILVLQEHAEHEEECLDTCDRGFLGRKSHPKFFNTRPVVLYTCCGNGIPWSMPTEKEDINCGLGACNEEPTVRQPKNECSTVFRVEKLDDGCATFRVLKKEHRKSDLNGEEHEEFEATNSFFTMNLDCCCAIRCLNDTFVEGV